jgi:hypothetical protein
VRAVFHDAVINEVMSGAANSPSVQYVEIRMRAPFQNSIGGTRLTAFSCDGSTHAVLLQLGGFDSVPNEGPGVTWIMASPSGAAFLTAAGITPDFTWDSGTTGSIAPACGMVCWGAPGDFSVPDPMSWNASNPNAYTDCVAYGGYTGPRKTMPGYGGGPTAGTPSALAAGDGMLSLSRAADTNNNVADFALACPTPTNNAGNVGSFGACTPPSTTTTLTSPTTTTTGTAPRATTTTLPPGTAQPLAGAKLALRDNPANAAKRALQVVSRDAAVNLGAGNGTSDDPTGGGGRLRVRTTAGCGAAGADACDDTYDLPPSGWTRTGKGANKGYRYRDGAQANGPIKSVVVKPGRRRLVSAKGKGSGLGHMLLATPAPVDIVLSTGTRDYCLRFGGTPRVTKTGRQYVAAGAPAPVTCR